MSRYIVKAVSVSGEARMLESDAPTEDDAALEAAQAGLVPLSVAPEKNGLLQALSRPLTFRSRIPAADVALLLEQLGTMTDCGLTAEQALKTISRQAKARPTTRIASRALSRIQAGETLSAAFSHEPSLPTYLSGMVRAGEASGRLADGLMEASRYLQRQADTRSVLINALTYPFIIFATVIVALVLVLTLVVPAFEPIFAGEEHRLPGLTRAVLTLSNAVVEHFPTLCLAFGTAIASGIIVWRRSHTTRQRFHVLAERLPPVQLAGQLDAARTLSILGILFKNGVEVSEAFALASTSAAGSRLREALVAAVRQLREGGNVSAVARTLPGVPEDTCGLIDVGQHTGQLGPVTTRAAELLEASAACQLQRWVALANPMAIALLGAVVGLVVGGVMLGVLSINQLALTR